MWYLKWYHKFTQWNCCNNENGGACVARKVCVRQVMDVCQIDHYYYLVSLSYLGLEEVVYVHVYFLMPYTV
jgi:hypothetical protein